METCILPQSSLQYEGICPKGAFYIYAGIEHFAADRGKFALDHLQEGVQRQRRFLAD